MDADQRLFFETNGYLRLPGALTGTELDRVRTAADRAETAWRADTSRPGLRQPNLEQVQAILEYDDCFLELLEHPRVLPLVRTILGDDVSLIDHDYYLTPPRTASHAHWHHDVGMPGIYHPRSAMMVKVFYLLTDVSEDGGATGVIPGSHRFSSDFPLPEPATVGEMPGHVRMTGVVGDGYLFNGRIYHAALDNGSDRQRRVLIFNYGHHWMKIWPGYEPSPRLLEKASTAVRRQLLGLGPAYGQRLTEADWDEYCRVKGL